MVFALRDYDRHTYGDYCRWPEDVRYELIDGQAYWLAPTRETQFGRLDKVHQPDYGQAGCRDGNLVETDLLSRVPDAEDDYVESLAEHLQSGNDCKRPNSSSPVGAISLRHDRGCQARWTTPPQQNCANQECE